MEIISVWIVQWNVEPRVENEAWEFSMRVSEPELTGFITTLLFNNIYALEIFKERG